MLSLCNNPYIFLIVAAFIVWLPAQMINPFLSYPNKAQMKMNEHQYKAITFITYPLNLHNKNMIGMYKIQFTSILSLSNNTRLVIYASDEDPDGNPIHSNKLVKYLQNRYGKDRVLALSFAISHNYPKIAKDFYKLALEHVKTKIVCFTNPGIIFDKFWYERTMLVFDLIGKTYHEHLSVTGQTITIPLKKSELQNFDTKSHHFYRRLDKLFNDNIDKAYCRQQNGTDYLAISINPIPMYFNDLPDLLLDAAFVHQFIFNVLEGKTETVNLNTVAPVYYLGKPPKFTKTYLENSQFNYDLTLNTSRMLYYSFNILNRLDGNNIHGRGFSTTFESSKYNPLLKLTKCQPKDYDLNIDFHKPLEESWEDFTFNDNFSSQFDNAMNDPNKNQENDEVRIAFDTIQDDHFQNGDAVNIPIH
ncbi:hypothetical protein TRFO_15278 [Tritrichomonas foetus]|uniref:Uncharacterized protein n=1 Tax=Tritrichomonas foetus TaxID=1144522 RepID=A0A1J4KTX2_9EUKA|nr:hypothetical protein TRFO_15278 [Tritrichomonas foetus]|eukprot:OHT14360.1 hypothetical protein TRFO_15278 [Tritrichomonas foetus]